MKQVWVADEADVLSSLDKGPLPMGAFSQPGEQEAIANLLAAGKIRKVYRGALGLMGCAELVKVQA